MERFPARLHQQRPKVHQFSPTGAPRHHADISAAPCRYLGPLEATTKVSAAFKSCLGCQLQESVRCGTILSSNCVLRNSPWTRLGGESRPVPKGGKP